MEGALGSGNFEVKPDEGKVFPSYDIDENEGDNLRQTGFDLNDDPIVSSLKEVEDIDECGEDGEVCNLKVGDLNQTDRDKDRGDDNEDKKDNNRVKKKVEKEGLKFKVQYSGRVLRSMSAVKNGSGNEGDKGETGGDKTGYSYSCEKKLVEEDKQDHHQYHAEAKEAEENSGRRSKMKCSDRDEKKAFSLECGQSNPSGGSTLGKEAKRKRGRPPKFHKRGRPPKFQGNDGFEKTVELQVEENDYLDGEVRKECKSKPRRPVMVAGKGEFERKAVKTGAGENDHLDGDVSKGSKCKRGRPPKLQVGSGFDKSTAKLEAIESYQCGDSGTKKSKHKRGRATKVQGNLNQEFEQKAGEVKARETYYYDVETWEETTHKHGLQPTMHSNYAFEMKAFKVETKESDQFDGELRKEVRHKRGRPPKVPGSSGLVNKRIKLERQGAGLNNSKVMEGVIRKRGRPPKLLGSKVMKGVIHKCGRPPKLLGSKVMKGVIRKRGRPPKVLGSKLMEGVIRKRGRPPKIEGVIRKRGRPPKVEGVIPKQGRLPKMEGVIPKRGRPPKLLGTKVMEGMICKRGRPPKVLGSKVMEGAIRKRGRPPKLLGGNKALMGKVIHGRKKLLKAVKVEMEESDLFNGELRREVRHKRGRPPKVLGSNGLAKNWVELEREGSGQNDSNVMGGVICKRGRPPKLLGNSKALTGKVIHGRKKLDGLRRGRKKLRGTLKFNVPANNSYSDKRLIGKESNDSKASIMLRPKAVNLKGKKKRMKEAGNGAEFSRSEAKQAVRDRIVKLLKAAGWTIDYRPRISKEYNDTVYVNPEGKAHWSITLAYKKLKRYYESGDSASKVSPNGFIFTPIPEEELSILKRIVRKKRVGKKNPRGEGDEVAKKMNKRKKKWKGNENVKKKKRRKLLKGNCLLSEEKNSDGILPRGTQVLGKRRKLLQTQDRKRYALLVRNAMTGAESDNNGYVLYDGKRSALTWMIDLGTVPLDGKVEYMIQRRTRTRESKSGRITRNGIQCNCCGDVFTIAEFEIHAGSKLHRPLQNICLETGISLLQCLLESWNKQQQSKCKGFHFVDFGSDDPNDDTCGICGDGGDLICCDSCPSTFHQSCLDIRAFPSGRWNCVYCTCKYCGMVGNPYQRNKDEAMDTTVFTCQLCEEKYHQLCIQPMDGFDDNSGSEAFCGKRCKELFEKLEMLVGVKHKLPEGFSWMLVRRFDISSDVCVNEAYQKVESNSKLAVALSVMDECFLPLVDHRSGINLIHNIVYNFGSNFTRLNYSGFFTAILERGDEIITVASIRIHGNQLAEMPFIGTRYAYRRQGMCRRLLCAVESALSFLNVEKLVIPAVSELRETWTSVFGFQLLDTASKQNMRKMNLMVFPGVDMLQKSLLAHVMEDQMMGEGSKQSGEKCPAAFDLNVSAESTVPQTDEKIEEPVKLTFQLSDGNLKDTSDIMIVDEAITLPEPATVYHSCIPAAEEMKLDNSQLSVSSEGKIGEGVVEQNLDSNHGGSVKISKDIVCANNEAAVVAHVSSVAGQNVVTNGFDGMVQMSDDANDIKHLENSKSEVVRCVSDPDKIDPIEKVKNCHVVKDGTNGTYPSSLPSAEDVANGQYDVQSS